MELCWNKNYTKAKMQRPTTAVVFEMFELGILAKFTGLVWFLLFQNTDFLSSCLTSAQIYKETNKNTVKFLGQIRQRFLGWERKGAHDKMILLVFRFVVIIL